MNKCAKLCFLFLVLFSANIAMAKGCNESFDNFYAIFSNNVKVDSIRFPVSTTHLVDANPEPETIVAIHKRASADKVIERIDRGIDYAKQHGAIKTVSSKSATAYTVKYSGPDNGFLIQLYFESNDGCWSLVRFEDWSM